MPKKKIPGKVFNPRKYNMNFCNECHGLGVCRSTYLVVPFRVSETIAEHEIVDSGAFCAFVFSSRLPAPGYSDRLLGKTFNEDDSKKVCQICGGFGLIKRQGCGFEEEEGT